jgi:hypothetical protein
MSHVWATGGCPTVDESFSSQVKDTHSEDLSFLSAPFDFLRGLVALACFRQEIVFVKDLVDL